MRAVAFLVALAGLVPACSTPAPDDAGPRFDGSLREPVDPRSDAGDTGRLADAPPLDGAAADAPREDLDASGDGDGGLLDAGSADAGPPDADVDGGEPDAGLDAGGPDAGVDAGPPDAGVDAGPPDAGVDAGAPDAGAPDAGPPAGGCISGAVGTHVARFRWAGSGSGSTAYVVYEANTLPDSSRWRAGAYSMSIGYTPVFGDVFLGAGGLEMSGTVFMDIDLSTVGLSSIRGVTVSILGRSYSTGSSGSFTWQTFTGTGATPSGSVANSAPYEWYGGDATAAFRPGDGSVLLRIRPGPPSGALVVNRVEICFDAS